MKAGICLVLITLLLCCSKVRSTCEKIDSCSCRDSDSGEVLSLASLAHTDNTAALSVNVESANYTYLYNPCVAFTVLAGSQCENVALCQEDFGHSPTDYYGLGNQSTIEFNEISGFLNFVYVGHDTAAGDARITRVQMICDETATTPEFRFVAEPQGGFYLFSLRSVCACPGKCKPLDSCVADDPLSSCSCKFDDGRHVNINSLNQPNAPLIVHSSNATVTLNPCTGVTVGPSDTECRDVTVCLQQSGGYLDYGSPDNVAYTSTQEDNLVLTYKSKDLRRRTNIHLVCDEAERHFPKVSVDGEPTSTELNIELRSVCACPDQCLNPHVNCERIDDCSCRLEDGGGTVSLHNLDNPVAPFIANSSDQFNAYVYYYNPCSKFSAPDPYLNCTDVAACQVIPKIGKDFNIGVQDGVSFRVSSSEMDVVSLHYVNGGDGRNTFVQLACNATRAVPIFRFVQEKPVSTYYFSLESRDVCLKGGNRGQGETRRKRPRTRI